MKTAHEKEMTALRADIKELRNVILGKSGASCPPNVYLVVA